MLNTYQRLVWGFINTGPGSIIALLEGVTIFYYNDHLSVSLEFLGLANFVVGALAAFSSIIIGTLSDRAVAKYRRKIYVLLFAPILAAGVFLRFGAFTTKEFAPIYYTLTYAMQIIGVSGLEVVAQAWGCEIATTVEERNKLYTISGLCSYIGIFAGILLTLFPLFVSGVVCSIFVIIGSFLSLILLPDATPMNKRAFIPTICNIKSVLWNSQFKIYLYASCFMYFVNTLPPLLMFFIKYCFDMDNDAASTYYTVTTASFVVLGLTVLPLMPYIVKTYGVMKCVRGSFLVAATMGLVLLASSYISIYMFVATFGIAGMFCTVANVALNILNAEAVDYDELLCGKRRASSYAGVITPVRMFITISGTSIPLALMSVLGFRASDDDHDDGTSTLESTWVLRIWCSLFLSLCMTCAYLIVSNYKIDEHNHEQILELLQKKEVDGEVDTGILNVLDDALALEANIPEIEVEINSKVNNDSYTANPDVIDPVTEMELLPPPYVVATLYLEDYLSLPYHEVEVDINADKHMLSNKAISKAKELELRRLAWYFPQLLHLCCTQSGRNSIITLFIWESVVSLGLLILGCWESVRALSLGEEFSSYLMVVLTCIYAFYFCSQIMLIKGISILYLMGDSDGNVAALEYISGQMHTRYGRGFHNKNSDCNDPSDSESSNSLLEYDDSTYLLTVKEVTRMSLSASVMCIVSYVVAFLLMHVIFQ